MARTVEEIMTTNPRTVNVDDTVLDAARVMRDNDIGDVIVVEDGQVTGIVTDRDIAVRAVAAGRFDARVADIMSGNPSTVREDDDVGMVSRLMAEQQVRRIPVVNAKGAVVGMIAQADLALRDGPIGDREVGQVVERISEPEGARSART
jgi:CBS domain-containing protein